jgi:epoxide hydrolase-like predicted phosphatase
MIQAIIFDCFGVLTTDLWRAFVATLPVEQLAPVMELNHVYDAGLISHEYFITHVQQLTGRKVEEVENQIEKDIYKNVDLLASIRTLKQDYKIGLLSNVATDWVQTKLLSNQEQALFDSMVFSYQVQLFKPDKAIFELVAERLGVATSNCVMIDDQPANCEGAQAAGMQAIQYRDNAQTMQKLGGIAA